MVQVKNKICLMYADPLPSSSTMALTMSCQASTMAGASHQKKAQKETQSKQPIPPTWIPSPRTTHTAPYTHMGTRSGSTTGSWGTRRSGKSTYALGFSSPSSSLTPIATRHLNIGAGRIVWQDIVRIDVSITKRQFHQNPTILASTKRAKEGNGRLHLLGLVRTRGTRNSVVIS